MKNTITKSKALKLINDAYWKIEKVLSSVAWGQYGNQYLDMNIKEEKGHRGSRDCAFGLTVKEAAKLFYVRQIVEYLTEPKRVPTIKEYLFIRQSCFMAASLAENYQKELAAALQGVDVEAIRNLDYAELVKL